MYCINCGVKLADTEKVCPLCNTRVFHPDLTQGDGEALYPPKVYPKKRKANYLIQFVLTFLVILPTIIVLLCDLQINQSVTWSGYVMGALTLGYISVILPSWFSKPNPVIFVPVGFCGAGLFLMYINLYTEGDWFLSFAFPIVGGLGILITALVTLLKYVKKGKLYTIGGFIIALGVFFLPLEFLVNYTFHITKFIGWSLYPLVSLSLLGLFLIFVAIYKPAREVMERRFFI